MPTAGFSNLCLNFSHYLFKTRFLSRAVVDRNTNNESVLCRMLTGVLQTDALPRENAKLVINRGHTLMHREFTAALCAQEIGLEVSTTVIMRIVDFCVVTPCSLETARCFGGLYRIHLQTRWVYQEQASSFCCCLFWLPFRPSWWRLNVSSSTLVPLLQTLIFKFSKSRLSFFSETSELY